MWAVFLVRITPAQAIPIDTNDAAYTRQVSI